MDIVGMLNGNPYMSAISMIFMNLGSRYIALDISKAQENLLKNPLVRRFTVFCILYVATRDIMMSLILLGVFMFVMGHLLHEDSPLSLLPEDVRKSMEVSKEEYAKAQEVIAMYETSRRDASSHDVSRRDASSHGVSRRDASSHDVSNQPELAELEQKKTTESRDGVYVPRALSAPQKTHDTLISQREPFAAYANAYV